MASGWVLGQLEREYAAAGLRLSPAGVAPDHAAVELEFMALLCGREAQAWEERRLAQGIEALQRQKAFLDGHLTRWLPRFAGQVAAADGGGFYAAVGELAQAFVSHDSDLLDVLLETFPVAAEAP